MATVVSEAQAPPVAAPAGRPLPPKSIVPLAGIPIAAAVLIFLVVSIGFNWTWALDFYHVAGGGAWTALDLFLGFVIGPILGMLSIPARTELVTRLMPKLALIVPVLVTMTLGAGFQLARHNGMLDTSYPRHGWVVASFVVVAVLAVIAIGLLEPANLAVIVELGKPEPNGALIGHLMKRFIYTAAITGAMQIATLIIMTRLAT